MASFYRRAEKVKAFFESSYGSSAVSLGSPFGASFSMGKKAWSGLGMEPEKTGGKGTFGEVHSPMFAEVVRLVVSHFALEEGPSVHLGDPLVKDLADAEGTLGQKSTAREIDACPFGDVDNGVGLQRGKGNKIFLLRAWKGKLEKIKGFVDRSLACIL